MPLEITKICTYSYRPLPAQKLSRLVTVDLVERLFDGHTAPLQFHMNQRQTVYQNRDIIAVIIVAAILHILVNDLQAVVVDVLFIQQRDIDRRAVLAGQILNVILLDAAGLFFDAIVRVGDFILKKKSHSLSVKV